MESDPELPARDGARDRVLRPKPDPGEAADPLYTSAYQLARFYAILSPGILQRELEVDRARAERLIALLVERDVLGPVMIEHSGARESRVNMIFDGEGRVELSPGAPTTSRRAGGLGIVATVVAVLLGLGACAGMIALGLGLRVASGLGLALLSPAIAEVAGLLVLPAAGGALVAFVVEHLLSPDEGEIPYRALQARRSLWTVYALAALGYGSLQLFR